MATTMNGHVRIDTADSRLTSITAGGKTTRVKTGDAAVVLAYVAARFHAEVEALVTLYGWRSLATNTASGGIANSNHLSGTALDLNGAKHPRYKTGTFTTAQVAALRKILAAVNAAAGATVVRWGGDWGKDVDEMHIEVVGTTAALARAAAAISAGQLTSSGGTTTGTVADVPTLIAPDPLTPLDTLEDPMLAPFILIKPAVDGTSGAVALVDYSKTGTAAFKTFTGDEWTYWQERVEPAWGDDAPARVDLTDAASLAPAIWERIKSFATKTA